MNYTVIFAGGIGSRMGSSIPKQFLEVAGKPIIIHTIEKFAEHPEIDGIVVVSKEEYIDYCRDLISKYNIGKIFDVIAGGETGQQTIFHGLDYLYNNVSHDPKKDIVLIHDGVRPLINGKLITESIKCTKKNGNSIAAAKAIETVIRVNDEGKMKETVDREKCRNAKAPQCFFLEDIINCHHRAIADGRENMIDSATLMSVYGYTLYTTECGQENIKITTPIDYYMFKGMYENSEDTMFENLNK